jgi:hypothetical protein
MRSKFLAAIFVSIVLAGGALPPAVDAASPSSKFKDCPQLLKRYKNGVAQSRATRAKTKAVVNSAVYRANRALDRNKNGIACDSGDGASPQSWASVEFSGVGPDVKALTNPATEPAIVSFTHDGESNFAVWSLNAELEQIDLLVNEIGSYSGMIFLSRGYSFSPSSARHLEIEDAEEWTAKVAPASSAPQFLAAAKGSGDSVLRYGGSRVRLEITYSGEGNFSVTTFSKDGFYGDLLVNEIDEFSGTVVLPSDEYIVVSADGDWTLTKK